MKRKEESSFFEKKEAKKLLLPRPMALARTRPSARYKQKFFGSRPARARPARAFFQKRTFLLHYPAHA
jgi:hypothetical protein